MNKQRHKTRYFVLVHGVADAEGKPTYTDCVSGFKNQTSAEWWVENNLPAGTTVTIKAVTKVS